MSLGRGPEERPTLIQTRDLCLFHDGIEVLHHVALSIEQGLVSALSGPTGSGKTSLLLALCRLAEREEDREVHGEVLFKGTNIYATRQDLGCIRRRIAYLAPEPSPFNMSVRANLLWACKAGRWFRGKEGLNGCEGAGSGLDKNVQAGGDALVEAALEQVGLWVEIKDKLSRNALELSPGQQQRLCIARALAAGAEVLLLDEPGRDLDPLSTGKLEAAIGAMAGTTTIVVATANTRQAARVSQRASILIDGQLVEEGDTSELFSTPRDPRTEAFISGSMTGGIR